MAKAPGFGAGGARFESRYDLVKDHLPVKLALYVCNRNALGALLTKTFNL